jgi:GxxExxY protein
MYNNFGMEGGMMHEELTREIIGCAFEVINELGSGFLESVYEKAMIIALADSGLAAESQQSISVSFRNQSVGEFFADLLVEGKVLVELKAAKSLTPEHQAQVINYLKATGIEVGLLINFGNSKLEIKRFSRDKEE